MATEERVVQRGGDQGEMEIDLVELFYRLLEKIRILILAAVLGALIAAVYTFYFVTPIYEATSRLYVLNSKDSVVNLSDLQMGSNLANDYIEVFSTWNVSQRVLENLGLEGKYTINQAKRMVNVTNSTGTRILNITVASSDNEEARAMALEYARVAKEFIASTMGTDEPTFFEEPLLPTTPSSPNKTQNIAIGFIAGLFVAAAVVVIQFFVDDRVRSAEGIERKLMIPVLGMMPAAGQDTQARTAQGDHERTGRSSGGKGGQTT